MPAGSGPQVAVINAVSVGTAETAVGVIPASNWSNPLGNLVESYGTFTPPASGGSLVLKIRQGNGTAGTQVGPTVTLPVTASTVMQGSVAAVDATAFGLAQQQGQYTVTAQFAAASGGTITGLITLETIAPVQ